MSSRCPRDRATKNPIAPSSTTPPTMRPMTSAGVAATVVAAAAAGDRLEVEVGGRRVGEQHGSGVLRLASPALELVGAVRLRVGVVIEHHVRALRVEERQHLMHQIHSLGLVELDLLLFVQRVVLGAAPVGVVVPGRRGIGGDLRTGHVAEHRVGVHERSPSPHEHVVLAPGDDVGELCLVESADLGVDADLLQPPGDEVADRNGLVAVGEVGVAELQRLAAVRHLAHAVAVGVLVAGVLERLLRPLGVEVELLVGRDLGRPHRIGRHAQGRQHLALVVSDTVEQLSGDRWPSPPRGPRPGPAAPGGRRRCRPPCRSWPVR